jgi:hypothetical protein
VFFTPNSFLERHRMTDAPPPEFPNEVEEILRELAERDELGYESLDDEYWTVGPAVWDLEKAAPDHPFLRDLKRRFDLLDDMVQAAQVESDREAVDAHLEYEARAGEVLVEKNWGRTVQSAIDLLPEDISECIGVEFGDRKIIIKVVADSMDVDIETELRVVEVEWFHSQRERGSRLLDPAEVLEGKISKDESRCRPMVLEAEQLDWAIVVVRCGEMEQGCYPGRADVLNLRYMVQTAILDEMFVGELIEKDEDGRYFRNDGSEIKL